MNSSEFYYPIDRTFFYFIKVIPQLIEIINQNQSSAPLIIPGSLKKVSNSRTISETISVDNSHCYFFLQDQNKDNMCYHFSFKNSKEHFVVNVSFSKEYFYGKIRFEFNNTSENSALESKIRKMIKDYVNYSSLTDKSSLYIKQGEGFSQAGVSLRFGFSFGTCLTSDVRLGGGVSYSLKEFVKEKKGHDYVKSVFSIEELNELILAAELRLNYPYLFKI